LRNPEYENTPCLEVKWKHIHWPVQAHRASKLKTLAYTRIPFNPKRYPEAVLKKEAEIFPHFRNVKNLSWIILISLHLKLNPVAIALNQMWIK
jgi:hypothetical protein